MSQRLVIAVFLIVVAAVAIVFCQKPPRAQAHLASVDDVIKETLRDLPPRSRIYFTADSAVQEAYVWSRYFAAPHRLLPGGRGTGDTMLWLHNMTSIDISTPPSGREIRAAGSGRVKASLIVLH